MKLFLAILTFLLTFNTYSQSSLKGVLKNDTIAVEFAYVAVFNKLDSGLVKVERTDTAGGFYFGNLNEGLYFFKAVYVGLNDLIIDSIAVAQNEQKDLGEISFNAEAVNLDEVVITTQRKMVQVKPDRTIFNVEGTINSTGSNALELLRKAPAVTVDNNDNISVMGRSGVLVYVDGKLLPLQGADLSNYLKNLPADQIDRFEIITNPGAKYDAEGNAGIIDIRLKKNDKIGANGTLSATYTQGILTRYNFNGSGNYRNKRMNVFGTAGYNVNDNFHNINFQSYQNGLYLDEINNTQNNRDIMSFRVGTDFYLNDKNTIGFLVDGRSVKGETIGYNKIDIAKENAISVIDSTLIAENSGENSRTQNTFNINYMFDNKKGKTLNVDLDYGIFDNKRVALQPNRYYAADNTALSEVINSFQTPNNISIYTGKVDYEMDWKKSKIGLGTKFSRVETKNTFEVYDVLDGQDILNTTRSNLFDYDENVYAAYLSYAQPIGEKFQVVAGLRTELTDAEGNLTAYESSLNEEPVLLNYINFFPNAGITYNFKKVHSLNLNYGRRINRPDYNVLNPFRNQLSELSIEKGNPFLKPEIVNNIELGYTLFYMFNFKLGYGRTENKITRLIGPDDSKPQAGFISWDNLTTQSVWSFNASLPMKFAKWWRSYTNAGLSYVNNQADYGNGAIVDVQTFSYSIFQQHTFKLIKGFTGEISGYYSGPGVWGGTFVYDPNWSLNAGLQKSFLKDNLNARLSVNNIFNRIGWRGTSTFNGLVSYGDGMWDSRFVSLSLSYNFGNQNIKSRKRKTGLESESKRVQ